jgi:hypothetical protein
MPVKSTQETRPGAAPSPRKDTTPKASPKRTGAPTSKREYTSAPEVAGAKTRPKNEAAQEASANGRHTPPASEESDQKVNLDALAERVKAEHQAGLAATRKAIEHYIAAGRLLIEVRRECERLGVRFTKWLKVGKAGVSKARAYHYIALAELSLVTRQLTSEELEEHWRQISNGTAGDTGNRRAGGGTGESEGSESTPGDEEDVEVVGDEDDERQRGSYTIHLEPEELARFEEEVDFLAKLHKFDDSSQVISLAVSRWCDEERDALPKREEASHD